MRLKKGEKKKKTKLTQPSTTAHPKGGEKKITKICALIRTM